MHPLAKAMLVLDNDLGGRLDMVLDKVLHTVLCTFLYPVLVVVPDNVIKMHKLHMLPKTAFADIAKTTETKLGDCDLV